MVTMLEGCIKKEQRSVMCFLWAKGLDAKDSHKEMFPAHGGKCLSHKAVHNWVKKICQGRSKVTGNAIRKSQVMPDQVALLRL
jgi:hypothetical protein